MTKKATEGPATLGAALLYVYSRIGYVQKSGQVSGFASYSYAGEADFIHAIRPVMIAAGLVLLPIKTEAVTVEHAPTRKGGKQFRCDVLVTYRLLHAASGEGIDIQTPGCGLDSGDKASNKAMTGALKYALRQTFLIETGDDPDQTASEPNAPAEVAHHPSWTADRPRFCAELNRLGTSYDAIRAHALGVGWGKPSTWRQDQRTNFVNDLKAGKLPDLVQPHQLGD